MHNGQAEPDGETGVYQKRQCTGAEMQWHAKGSFKSLFKTVPHGHSHLRRPPSRKPKCIREANKQRLVFCHHTPFLDEWRLSSSTLGARWPLAWVLLPFRLALRGRYFKPP